MRSITRSTRGRTPARSSLRSTSARVFALAIRSTLELRASGFPRRNLRPRVIRAANERTGLDVPEAERARAIAERGKRLRRDEAHDRKVLARRPQILADGENVAAGAAEILEHREELLVLLAETGHQAAL